MGLKNEILMSLQTHKNTYISGEALAKQFGKSRAAVWKAVKQLKKEGYSIDAITNKGYLLTQDNDLLSAECIKSGLPEEIEVFYFPSVDSTNTQAKRFLNEGKTGTMLLVAEEQTAGRGRQGKAFYSPPMTGIYMSLVLHPQLFLQNAVTMTTAAAVAVCRAVEKLTDKKPLIKWVNDVYLNDKKICGILTEAVSDFESGTVQSVIIGIGINIKTIDFPDNIPDAASLNADINRAELIAQITKELLTAIRGDYRDIIDYYKSHSMMIGQKINFIKDGKITPATATAIDERGGLEVLLENGEKEVLRSGEISIRKRVD